MTSGYNGKTGNGYYMTDWAGQHAHNIWTGNSGNSLAHNNLSPYLTINYIIKT